MIHIFYVVQLLYVFSAFIIFFQQTSLVCLLQKESFQMYECYCQNKPRSEALWRQFSDCAFFLVSLAILGFVVMQEDTVCLLYYSTVNIHVYVTALNWLISMSEN